jgi:hypothetical protein
VNLLLVRHSSGAYRRGSHCCHQYRSSWGGVKINEHRLIIAAHQLTSPNVSMDRHRQYYDEWAASTCTSRVKWIQLTYILYIHMYVRHALWCFVPSIGILSEARVTNYQHQFLREFSWEWCLAWPSRSSIPFGNLLPVIDYKLLLWTEILIAV